MGATPAPGRSPDRLARRGGVLLLLAAAATAVMVSARAAAGADQDTLLESLRAVAENRAAYILFGAARVTAGAALLAAGWFLLRTWNIRDRWASSPALYLFVLSGLCTAVSGVCALLIAVQPGLESASAAGGTGIEAASTLQWLAGKAGFSAAGLALVVAARSQWRAGGTLHRVAPLSAVLGIGMQLIWVEAATVVHAAAGSIFLLWLVAAGAMLTAGRAERRAIVKYGAGAGS